MIKVVNVENNKVQATYDAWVLGSYEYALNDIRANGAVLVKEDITLMGDMILWIRFN